MYEHVKQGCVAEGWTDRDGETLMTPETVTGAIECERACTASRATTGAQLGSG
jgi:hypothetical protein